MSKIIVGMQARLRATYTRKKYLQSKRRLIFLQKWFKKCLAKKRFKARLTAYKIRIEHEQQARLKQQKLLELKEVAMKEKKKEREMIMKGLRKIDEQEAHVDPQDLLKVRIQSRMLTELTNLDFLRMRYIFTFSGKKGMDRIGFTKFIWEISKFKPIDFSTDFQLTDEQEQIVTSLFTLFDKDRDGKVHLRDIIGFLAVMILGSTEDKLEQGFPFFDPDGYGDFSKDTLQTIISNLVRMMQTPPTLPLSLFNISVVKDRSSYVQIHFDMNVVADGTNLYTTLMISTAMKTPDVIRAVCEKKGFSGEKESPETFYSLYEIRMQNGKIIYQRRLDSRERPADIMERWTEMENAEYMRFILAKNPENVRRRSTKNKTKNVIELTYGRNVNVELSSLPFIGDDDCIGRGFVTVYYQADHKTTDRNGPRSIDAHVYKNLPIDTSITSLDLIELFLHKNRMEKLKKSSFLLYMIRVSINHTVTYERPLEETEIPLALMAMTGGSEDPCRFLLVEQEIILQKPVLNAAPTLRQVNCYLENPTSTPKPTRIRTQIDYVALKRLAFGEEMSAEEIKEKFFEASHAGGFASEYELHLVQVTEDKKLIYERVLLPDERILLGLKQKKGAAPMVTQFLMVRRPAEIIHASAAIRDSFLTQETKKHLEALKEKDFAFELAEAAFATVDGYMNKDKFTEVGIEHEWIRDFFSLQAIFKRNKFIRVNQY